MISLKTNELFRQLPLSQHPKYADLKSYLQTMKISYNPNSIIKWVQNFHSILRYSESIYLKIVSFYNKFEINPIVVATNKSDSEVINYNKLADCKIFSKKQTNHFVTTKCENGDGILFGHEVNWKKAKVVNLTKLNDKTINFVNHLNSLIDKAGIEPVIVLEPANQFVRQDDYDTSYITENVNALLIDLTKLETTKDMWVDYRHLNNKGRLFYSNHLSNILKEVN